MRYRRVTISLPEPVLDALDRTLAAPDETRSAAIRRLLEEALRAAGERADVERWVRSYREEPQSADEAPRAAGFPAELARELPWG